MRGETLHDIQAVICLLPDTPPLNTSWSYLHISSDILDILCACISHDSRTQRTWTHPVMSCAERHVYVFTRFDTGFRCTTGFNTRSLQWNWLNEDESDLYLRWGRRPRQSYLSRNHRYYSQWMVCEARHSTSVDGLWRVFRWGNSWGCSRGSNDSGIAKSERHQ